MQKKYVSPLFAELELELEDILFDSAQDNEQSDFNDDDEPGWNDKDFDSEEEFGF